MIGVPRFTITSLLVITTLVAVLVTAGLEEIAVSALLFLVLPIVVFSELIRGFFWLQLFVADRFAGFFYSRGMFWFIRVTCGRAYSEWALSNYALGLYEEQKYEAASDIYSRALQLDGSSVDYWTNRGACKYEMNRYQDAISDLSQALAMKGKHQPALTYRGYALMMVQDFPAALDDLNRVECDTSDDFWVAYYRGYLNEQLNRWSCAFDEYVIANELDSSQTLAGLSIARLQAGCPDPKLRAGAKAVENANNICVRTNWKDWIAVSVLGAAYAEAGDFGLALKYAKMALELAPDKEKPAREHRIERYELRQPFRIPSASDSENLSAD